VAHQVRPCVAFIRTYAVYQSVMVVLSCTLKCLLPLAAHGWPASSLSNRCTRYHRSSGITGCQDSDALILQVEKVLDLLTVTVGEDTCGRQNSDSDQY